jgi:CheY-like chemotaxis protein
LERLAEAPRPDVVLLDMMMPVMNGPAMLAAMGADPALRGIPVVVLSSLPDEAVRARAKGAAAILRKPCTADEVLDAIARVLGEAREAGT